MIFGDTAMKLRLKLFVHALFIIKSSSNATRFNLARIFKIICSM